MIEPKSYKIGSGIFDIAKNLVGKTVNLSLAKKVINSANTKNLKRALDSEIGKELKKVCCRESPKALSQ